METDTRAQTGPEVAPTNARVRRAAAPNRPPRPSVSPCGGPLAPAAKSSWKAAVFLSQALSPLRVAPGGRYFETFDGEPFLFIGPNDSLDWPGLFGLFERCDVATADAYLQSMAGSGVTVLRLMLDYAQNPRLHFENPVGTFVPEMVQMWDDLFARCQALGLRVLLAPFDTFWFDRRWDANPYNAANGGPLARWENWLDNPAAIAAMIRRFEFVIARWGGSGVIAAWDLFNEIGDMWGGGGAAGHVALFERVSAAIRRAEQKHWGFTRPQTISRFGPDPFNEGYDALLFRAPYLDFATTHVYQKGTIDNPRDTVLPALDMGRWVRYALSHVAPGRPYTDSEHGPIHLHNDNGGAFLPEAFDDEYERYLMWAHLASGGAGSGMRWPARHPHLVTAGMKRAYASMAGFARLMDWRHFSPADARPDVALGSSGPAAPEETHVFGCRDDAQAVLWLLRGLPQQGHQGVLPAGRAALAGRTLALRGLRPGAYRATFWDTLSGACSGDWTGATNDAASGALVVPLPPFVNDLALAVRPAAAVAG